MRGAANLSDEDAHKIARLAVAAHVAENALRASKTVPTAELFEARRAIAALREAIMNLPSDAFEKIN